MLSRMEVTDPPKAAPTEMDASISSADSGSMENVNGIRIAMATGAAEPGQHADPQADHRAQDHEHELLQLQSCGEAEDEVVDHDAASARSQRELVDEPVPHEPVRKIDIEQIGADESEDRNRQKRGDHELPAVRISHQHRDEQHRRERGDDEADEPEYQAEHRRGEK